MKRGSEYAKRIKRLYHELLKKYGKPKSADPIEPIEEMIVGILALDTTIAKAQAVYKRLRQQMVDLNELRVTPAIELAQMIGDGVPLAEQKAQRIVDALNAARRRQDTLDLGFLRQRGRREAREYLESLDGVGPTVAAHVVLFSLGGHAVPVDDLTLYVLRKEELVDNGTSVAVAQGFLERWVSASEATDFVYLLSRYVSTHAPRVPLDKLPEMLSPAPPPAEPQPVPPPVEAKGKSAGKDKAVTKVSARAKARAPVARTAKAEPAARVRKKK